MNLRSQLILILFTLGASFLYSGCGYSPGYRLPRGVSKVSIPVFKNETIPFRKDLEYELTRAVKKEFQLMTPAEVTSLEDSNAILRGAVLRFEEGVLVESSSGEIQEAGIVVSVGIQLIRTRDQRVLLERAVEARASYSQASGETIEVARQEAITDIARRIIAEIEPWEINTQR
ncbi:hypothetical protein CBD41_06480 [bacterium TMED181]|nr:hypothetical protein [Planctomycetota bacterium]OUW43952.1 MAG: hypothetical protein CBD41_06480 [bacterium TMED181]